MGVEPSLLVFHSSLFLHVSKLEKHLYGSRHWMSRFKNKQTKKNSGMQLRFSATCGSCSRPSVLVLIVWKKFVSLDQSKNGASFEPEGREAGGRQTSAGSPSLRRGVRSPARCRGWAARHQPFCRQSRGRWGGGATHGYAEGPEPCEAGWAGCCAVPCAWPEDGGEPVCSCAWN